MCVFFFFVGSLGTFVGFRGFDVPILNDCVLEVSVWALWVSKITLPLGAWVLGFFFRALGF